MLERLIIGALVCLSSVAFAEDDLDAGTNEVVVVDQPVTPVAKPDAGQASTLVGSDIQLADRHLCTIRLPRAGQTAEVRAHRASRVLEHSMEDGRASDVRVKLEGSMAVILVGSSPVVQLDEADANAAGDASVIVHAEACAEGIRQGVRTELKRRTIANVVFSISLIVLSGLLAFLLLGAVSRSAARLTTMFEARATPAMKIGTIELLTPAATRVATSTAISIAKPIVQVAIVASWLLSSMSLLAVTAPLGRRLTGYLLVPLTTLVGRVGTALPVAVLVALGAFALAMLLRFLRVFFESVAQGGIHLGWLSPTQALPASVLIRAVAIIAGLLAAAPLVTGDTTEWGTLRIAGVAITVALALAAVPTLVNVATGTFGLLSGRLQTGTFVEIGPHAGKLASVTLTELRIVDRSGAEVRVPHVVTLFRPLRLLGDSQPSHYEIIVDARAPQGPIRKALVDALRRQGRAAHVELTEIEGERACYIAVGTAAPGEEDLASAIADALTRAGVAFARIRKLDDA